MRRRRSPQRSVGRVQEDDTEATRLKAEIAQLRRDRARLRIRLARAKQELSQVQEHLTKILSGRLFRYTRSLRHAWYRLKGEL